MALFFAHPGRVPYESAMLDLESLRSNTTLRGEVDAPFPKPAFVDRDVPLTVAWGGRDRLLPLRHRANVLACYPHARMMTIPGVGHVPMTDNPPLVASVLLAASSEPAEQAALTPIRTDPLAG